MSSTSDDGTNIEVLIRIRPNNPMEQSKLAKFPNVIHNISSTEVKVNSLIDANSANFNTRERLFTFDHVFGPKTTQEGVYNRISPMIDDVMAGYSCCLLAYGATSSGKSYSLGTTDTTKLLDTAQPTTDLSQLDSQIGIIPRAVTDIYKRLNSTYTDFTVKVSFVELYNEELTDLSSDDARPPLLRILEDTKTNTTHIQGLNEIIVTSPQDVFLLLKKAQHKRHVAETKLNDKSSRSHFIFTLTVHTKEYAANTAEEVYRQGQFLIVDLAGSESIGKSGAVQQTAIEAGKINQSLFSTIPCDYCEGERGAPFISRVEINSYIKIFFYFCKNNHSSCSFSILHWS